MSILVNQAQLASFGAVVLDGSKRVLAGSISLEGSTDGSTWAAISSDQYIVGGVTGLIRQGTVDSAGATVDWSNPIYTASTISFDAAAGQILDSAAQFVAQGFLAGATVQVTGSDSNDGTYTITVVAAGALTVTEALVAEDAGASMTLKSPYASFRATYSIINGGAQTDYSAELVTGTSANDGLFIQTEINPYPFGPDGELVADFVRFLSVMGPIFAQDIQVTTLSAIQANLGNVFINSLLTIGLGGAIGSGQTAWDTGVGYWWEYNEGTPRFSIGDSSANKVTWDGSALYIKGQVLLGSGSEIADVTSMATGAGFYTGTGSFASPITGLKLWNDGGFGRLAGYNNSVLQAGFQTDGKFGFGNGLLSAAGLRFSGEFGGTSNYSDTNNGGTFADDATVGTVVWTDPGNAAASDNAYAVATLSGGGAATEGPTAGGTFANAGGAGAIDWTNPGNAASSNNTYATAVLGTLTNGNQGPRGAGTAANDASAGSVDWSNPGNVVAADGSYASVVIPIGAGGGGGLQPPGTGQGQSHFLKTTNFGFSLSGGSTVTGVTVEVLKGATGLVQDNIARLVIAGSIIGNNYGSASNWPGSPGYAAYGGSSNTWGLSLTDADVNLSSFGFAITAQGTGGAQAFIDYIRITVYYTINNMTSNYLKATNFGFAIPAGATINGIEVVYEMKASSASAIRDNIVKLVKGGTISGTNKARSASTYWPTSDTNITYGGAAVLWGLTWLYSNINASTFGVVLSCKSVSGTPTASIDYVTIKIYYTTTGSGTVTHYLKVTNFGFALPSTATVDGVLVEVEGAAGIASNVQDNSVKVIKGAGPTLGTDLSTANYWPIVDTYVQYGGAADLCGLTLTYTEVNASTFGCVFSIKATDVPETFNCDHIRMTVYYSDSTGVSPLQMGGARAQGLGNGTLSTDAVALGQVIDGSGNLYTPKTLTTGAKAQARYFPMNINGTVVNVLTD